MPFSHNRFDEYMETVIKTCAYDKWLDIGAGAGKHGKMIRRLLPHANITGVEIETKYISKYKLSAIYNTVRPINAMRLMDEPKTEYEGIILGDIIEHLPKSQGLDLIHFLIYRCKTMVIIYPLERIQNSYEDSRHEAHISAWGEDDWNLFISTIIRHPHSHFVVLEGYIPHKGITDGIF